MSPSPRRSEAVVELRGGLRQAAVHGIAHDAQAAWHVDFTQPLEHIVTSLLALAAPQLERTELHSLSLADRHELVRAVWLLDGGGPAEVEAECVCGEGSEFELELAVIERPEAAESVMVRSGVEERTCALPTPILLEAAGDRVDVVAACLQCGREEAEPWVEVVEAALAEQDPLGAIELVGPCVACGRTLRAEFDLTRAWVGWLRGNVRRLMADVHTLARNYHWSEDEILRIPEARRSVYLGFCEVDEPVEA